MDRMLYVAMNGAKQSLRAQAVNANNLANISTTGFRAAMLAMREVPVEGQGLPTRVYARVEGMGVDLSPAPLSTTGRDLDVAVGGEGLIAVQAPDGTETYTRAGDLRLTATGLLTTGAGHPVLGNGGPITVPPFEKIEIGTDGTVSIQPLGQDAATLAVVDRIKLVNGPREEVVRSEYGLLVSRTPGAIAEDATVRLVPGALESSNVNAVRALVEMIDLGRQYEMQIKMMKQVDEKGTAMSKLMRIG